MPTLIAESLVNAVTRLDAAGAKRAWDFLAKFLANPAQPSLSLERITRARDRDVWSGRISQGLRAVIHQDGDTYTVLYAGPHDDAYDWARTHTFERNQATGEMQIVAAPHSVEAAAPQSVEAAAPHVPDRAPGLLAAHGDAYLLSLGLPPTWLPVMRTVTSEEQLLDVSAKLPEYVADRLLDLAAGKLVTPPLPIKLDLPAVEHPDAGQRVFLLESQDDLRRLLDAPLAAWLVFLHPSQRRLAEGSFNGPLKITGSAGTGKTVVALHRARHLAAQGRRVLLTSYVTTLCANLERNLALLCSARERERIKVSTVHSAALALLTQAGRRVTPCNDDDVHALIEQARQRQGCPLDLDLLTGEWEAVIQAAGITSWDEYRTASRAGRGSPLSVRERKVIWEVIAEARAALERKGLVTWSELCRLAAELLRDGIVTSPYDAVIVDEAQDLGPQELRLLAALAGDGPNGLTLVGDGGQRIYGRPISLKPLGIDVRGRSYVLRLNYRTTAQIRRFAESILGDTADDLDGGRDDRRRVRNLVGGPEPALRGFAEADAQHGYVVEQIERLLRDGLQPEEIAVFARKKDLLEPLKARLRQAGQHYHVLSSGDGAGAGINLATMHRAKGLEYKAVFVIDVSDDQVPAGRAYRNVKDPRAREEALQQERQLLYVSVTRARDEVHLTWVGEPSRFLNSRRQADLSMKERR